MNTSSSQKAHEVIESQEFKLLVKKRWAFSLSMALIMLLVYFSFLITIAFNKQVFAQNMGANLTLGILCGLGLILFAWIMTGIYVTWANRSYDQTVEELKNKL